MAVDLYCNNTIARLSFDAQSSPGSVDSFSSAEASMAPSFDNNHMKMGLVDSPLYRENDGLEFYGGSNSLSCEHASEMKTRPNTLTISGPAVPPLLSITTPELIGMLGGDDFDLSTGGYLKKGDDSSGALPNKRQKSDATLSNHLTELEARHLQEQTISSGHLQDGALASNPIQCLSSRLPPKNGATSELPHTVPIGPDSSISPINMEKQEIIKTERKRMRNRLAASKCRKRKLERISRLEEKVVELKRQNNELSSNASLLRQQVAELKSKVMSHVNSGCAMMTAQLAF